MLNETAISETGAENKQDSSVTQETHTQDNKTLSADEMQKELELTRANLHRANEEAKKHRLERDELKKFKDDVDAKSLSEVEKYQKQLSAVQAQYNEALQSIQESRIREQVYVHSQKLNIVDAEAASKLLDWSKIEYEDGIPTNVEKLLKELVAEKKYLIGEKQAVSSGGATNPTRSATQNSGELTWDAIGKMTQEEYTRRRPEIQKFINENPLRRY